MRRFTAPIGLALGLLSACATPDSGAISAIPNFESASAVPASVSPLSHSGRAARAPSGYVAFCNRNPQECIADRRQPDRISLTPETWAKLKKVNGMVNAAVSPEADQEHYGVADFWTVPVDGAGDCEDYVLAKRKMLVLLGLPEAALRITVVLDKGIVRHAVLTVITDKGDYVLDNQNMNILLWSETGYRFVKRQSQSDPNVWVSLGSQHPTVATATSR